MPHLWEIDHPYYCNQGNYFAHGSVESRFESWAEFLEDEGNADFDMNLVFRWDWRKADPAEENWGNETDVLLVFWMGQRKGLYRYSTIQVKDEDEPSVIEWLTKRWDHIRLLWQGISDLPVAVSAATERNDG